MQCGEEFCYVCATPYIKTTSANLKASPGCECALWDEQNILHADQQLAGQPAAVQPAQPAAPPAPALQFQHAAPAHPNHYIHADDDAYWYDAEEEAYELEQEQERLDQEEHRLQLQQELCNQDLGQEQMEEEEHRLRLQLQQELGNQDLHPTLQAATPDMFMATHPLDQADVAEEEAPAGDDDDGWTEDDDDDYRTPALTAAESR